MNVVSAIALSHTVLCGVRRCLIENVHFPLLTHLSVIPLSTRTDTNRCYFPGSPTWARCLLCATVGGLFMSTHSVPRSLNLISHTTETQNPFTHNPQTPLGALMELSRKLPVSVKSLYDLAPRVDRVQVWRCNTCRVDWSAVFGGQSNVRTARSCDVLSGAVVR